MLVKIGSFPPLSCHNHPVVYDFPFLRIPVIEGGMTIPHMTPNQMEKCQPGKPGNNGEVL